MKNWYKIFDIIVQKSSQFLFSIVVLLISYFTYKNSYGEDLLILTDRITSDYKTNVSIIKDFQFPSLINIAYQCKLTNNSNKPISIIKYEGKLNGTSCYQISYDLIAQNKVDLPIKLDPYETETIFLNLTYILDSTKVKMLAKAFALKQIGYNRMSVNCYLIDSILYANKIDIFGNDATITRNGGVAIGNGKINQEAFLITFETSSGNHFEKKVNYYPYNH